MHWSKSFIRFHGLRHPAEMGEREVEQFEQFLSWLAAERKVAASTHTEALSALLLLIPRCRCMLFSQQPSWLSSIPFLTR